jgi:hypothetical protein
MRSLYFGNFGVDLNEDGITVDTLYYTAAEAVHPTPVLGRVRDWAGHRDTATDVTQVNRKARRWERSGTYVVS